MKLDGRATESEGHIYVSGTNDELIDTRNHYGILIGEDGSEKQIILSLTSTQIKKSKQMMSLLSGAKIKGQTPPTWMNKVRITTVPESNDHGNWFGVKITAEGFITSKAQYDAGKNFHDLVSSGSANVDFEKTRDVKSETVPEDPAF